MREEAVERASNFSAQLAAIVCREEACKSDLIAVKKDSVKSRIERAGLQSSVSDIALKVPQASVALCGALRAVVRSSNRSSKVAVETF